MDFIGPLNTKDDTNQPHDTVNNSKENFETPPFSHQERRGFTNEEYPDGLDMIILLS